MSSWFAQIRKDPNMASTVKELSDRIAQITPAIDDSDETIRLLRTDEDVIAYADTDDNMVGGDRNEEEPIAYDSTDSTFTSADQFRVPGGDFLTFHIQTDSHKLRDFVGGPGGFCTQGTTRAYVGYSEAS